MLQLWFHLSLSASCLDLVNAIDKIVVPIFIKLGRHVNHDEISRMNPIDVEGLGHNT